MRYRVWDTDLGKLFGVFDSEEEALALVRLLAESYGEAAGDIAMTCERADGSFGEPISGCRVGGTSRERGDRRVGDTV